MKHAHSTRIKSEIEANVKHHRALTDPLPLTRELYIHSIACFKTKDKFFSAHYILKDKEYEIELIILFMWSIDTCICHVRFEEETPDLRSEM